MPELKTLVLSCTLKASPAQSSTDLLGSQLLDALAQNGAPGELIRIVDHNVKPGVTVDEGGGDEWPAIREKVMDADILVIATPIWMGHPSSICQRVLERLDAELSYTDDEGRLLTFGKVAAVAVVGNEDGAHHVDAQVEQALTDVGFTVAPYGATYWVGEAMHATDYKDLGEVPEKVAAATKTLASNTVHLARLLKEYPYPPVG